MRLPCESEVKQKRYNNVIKCKGRRMVPPTPSFLNPSYMYLISLKSDIYFKRRFVILSSCSTVLDDGVHTDFFAYMALQPLGWCIQM